MLLVIDGSEAPMRRLGATKLGRRSYIGDSSPLHLVKMRVWAEMSGVQGTGLGRAGCDLALPGSAVRVACGFRITVMSPLPMHQLAVGSPWAASASL